MKLRLYILLFVIYLLAFYGLVIEYIPSLDNTKSYVIILVDILITYLGISSVLYVDRKYIFCFLVLLLISILNFLNSGNSLVTHLNGLREVTNIFCLFIFFNHLFISGYQFFFNQLFKKFAIIFLITQIPFSVKQFVEHGATDAVGGTLGSGYSGILTLTIFILVYYLIENRHNGPSYWGKFKYLLSISYFFVPVFLNETKITFILIPILFVTLINFRRPQTVILSSMLAGGFLLLFSIYFSSYGKSYDNPISIIFDEDYLTEYLSGEETKGKVDVPRITKIVLATKLLNQDKFSLYFGQEYGAFKGGTTMGLTPFSTKYIWLLQGSRPYLFYVLITGGIALLVLILLLIIGLMTDRPFRSFKNYSNELLVFLSSIFLVILFYNDALRGEFFAIIFVYALFFGKYFKSPGRWVLVQ